MRISLADLGVTRVLNNSSTAGGGAVVSPVARQQVFTDMPVNRPVAPLARAMATVQQPISNGLCVDPSTGCICAPGYSTGPQGNTCVLSNVWAAAGAVPANQQVSSGDVPASSSSLLSSPMLLIGGAALALFFLVKK